MDKNIPLSVFFSGSTRIAMAYGVNAAIVHARLRYFIEANKQKQQHYIDGHYWTYATLEELHQGMPFLSVKQIRLAIQKLKEAGAIITANHNKMYVDHTTWYAIPDHILKQAYPHNIPDQR